jgi:hypothetical protein
VAAAARLARARSAGKTAEPLRRPRGGRRLRPAPTEALARSPQRCRGRHVHHHVKLSHTRIPCLPRLACPPNYGALAADPHARPEAVYEQCGGAGCATATHQDLAQGWQAGQRLGQDSKSKRAFCARPDARPSLRGHVPLAHLAPRLSRTSVCFSQRPPRKQASAPCSVRAGWLALLRPGAQAMPPRP